MNKTQAKKELAERHGLAAIAVVEARHQLLWEIRQALCIYCRLGDPLDAQGEKHHFMTELGGRGGVGKVRAYCRAQALLPFEKRHRAPKTPAVKP